MSRLTISILAVSSARNLFSRSNRGRERKREAVRVKKVSEFDEISIDVYIFKRGKESIVRELSVMKRREKNEEMIEAFDLRETVGSWLVPKYFPSRKRGTCTRFGRVYYERESEAWCHNARPVAYERTRE